MKKIFLFPVMMAVLTGSLAIAEASRLDRLEKIEDSKALMSLFSIMTDITRDGRPIEFFGWTEKEAVRTADATCAPATRSDAEHYLTNLIEQLSWASWDESVHMSTHLVPALADLREILANDQLERCDWAIQPEEQLIKFTRFRNTGTGYQLAFTQGFRTT